MRGKLVGVLNRLVGNGSMLSNILKQGSSVNPSKPVEVLNRPNGNGAMLAWYQDKPTRVLNKPVGSREISGKRDLVNAPLCTWFIENDNIYIYIKKN